MLFELFLATVSEGGRLFYISNTSREWRKFTGEKREERLVFSSGMWLSCAAKQTQKRGVIGWCDILSIQPVHAEWFSIFR
jgi:23S rRNA U2552 (ribose-2'-O)-methylase RlmE/FtsJ